jgi:hypothetical protein
MEGGAVRHNFEMGLPKNYPCQVWFNLVQRSLKSSPLKPLNQIKANLAGMVPFNIVSDSPALHSKWLLLLEIEISLVVNFHFITNQNELKFIYKTRGSQEPVIAHLVFNLTSKVDRKWGCYT